MATVSEGEEPVDTTSAPASPPTPQANAPQPPLNQTGAVTPVTTPQATVTPQANVIPQASMTPQTSMTSPERKPRESLSEDTLSDGGNPNDTVDEHGSDSESSDYEEDDEVRAKFKEEKVPNDLYLGFSCNQFHLQHFC